MDTDPDARPQCLSSLRLGGCRELRHRPKRMGREDERVWNAQIALYAATAWRIRESRWNNGRVRLQMRADRNKVMHEHTLTGFHSDSKSSQSIIRYNSRANI